MAEQITISFYADTDIEAALKSWAEEKDRSVSYILRQIILAERARRAPKLPLVVDGDEPQEESPVEQMNRAGCGRLVEA